MWHTAVGYLAVAATIAIVMRHYGAPRLLTRAFVLLGSAMSIMTILQANAGMVGSRTAEPHPTQEHVRPATYQPACKCSAQW